MTGPPSVPRRGPKAPTESHSLGLVEVVRVLIVGKLLGPRRLLRRATKRSTLNHQRLFDRDLRGHLLDGDSLGPRRLRRLRRLGLVGLVLESVSEAEPTEHLARARSLRFASYIAASESWIRSSGVVSRPVLTAMPTRP